MKTINLQQELERKSIESAARATSSAISRHKRVEKFLNAKFEVPQNLRPDKFKEFLRDQTGHGIMEVGNIQKILETAINWSAANAREAKAYELSEYEMTDEQVKALPDALKRYEDFCKDAIRSMRADYEALLEYLKGTKSTKTEKQESLKETA